MASTPRNRASSRVSPGTEGRPGIALLIRSSVRLDTVFCAKVCKYLVQGQPSSPRSRSSRPSVHHRPRSTAAARSRAETVMRQRGSIGGAQSSEPGFATNPEYRSQVTRMITRRNVGRTVGLGWLQHVLSGLMLAVFLSVARGDEESTVSQAPFQRRSEDRPIATGYVFIKGEYLSPPFVVSETAE